MVRASILHACLITAFVSAGVLPAEHCKNGTASISKRQQDLKPMDSKELEDSIKEEALLQKAHELQEAAYKSPMRNRVCGTPGHESTLQLIGEYLKTMLGNFSVAGQAYKFMFANRGHNESEWQNMSGSIVPIQNFGCNATDYPSELEGKVPLISKGGCDMRVKIGHSYRAKAVVLVNNSTKPLEEAIGLEKGWLREEFVPIIVISQADGQSLAAAATSAPLTAVLEVQQRAKRATSNIIVQTKGGDPNRVLMLGARTDSVFAGPDINNGGSGLIALLETALHLSKYKVNNAVRFTFWSETHNPGGGGMLQYLEKLSHDEIDNIRLYLDFYELASPNFAYLLDEGDTSNPVEDLELPVGSATARKFWRKWYAQHGIDPVDGKMDLIYLLEQCIPVGGIRAGNELLKGPKEATTFGGQAKVAFDVNYQRWTDTVDKLNMTAFVVNTKAIAASVAHFATSLDEVPPRNHSCPWRVEDPRRRG
ncbi:hypothetical protein CBER1_09787 [Cercospora berteroae]|uniref:Peptide hydrolase n=1 Tax=Cercospora berteroae TaxID=357750 RepID=A0A2S6BY39_9PEZI|nr:hypothetical protein CBER1_09787 [Cercospora berteroae]